MFPMTVRLESNMLLRGLTGAQLTPSNTQTHLLHLDMLQSRTCPCVTLFIPDNCSPCFHPSVLLILSLATECHSHMFSAWQYSRPYPALTAPTSFPPHLSPFSVSSLVGIRPNLAAEAEANVNTACESAGREDRRGDKDAKIRGLMHMYEYTHMHNLREEIA